MKRKSSVILVLISCLLICMIPNAFAQNNSNPNVDYTITTPYEYPVTPLMDKWKEFESHLEMIDACQIPDDILPHLSTAALAETVLNYPLLSDMLAWSDSNLGYQSVVSNFNGLNELLSREDGMDYLLNATLTLSSSDDINEEDSFIERNKIRCVSLIADNIYDNPTPYATPTPMVGAILTPNGSYIPYYKNLGFDDLAKIFGSSVPFTQSEIDDLERQYTLNYPHAEKVAPISPSYNCHSYAWYSDSPNNPYWVIDIAPYITDGSYKLLRPFNPKRYDIVLYTRGADVTHSAIYSNNIGEYLYLYSKWDFMGAYSHRHDYCPYYNDNTGLLSYTRN